MTNDDIIGLVVVGGIAAAVITGALKSKASPQSGGTTTSRPVTTTTGTSNWNTTPAISGGKEIQIQAIINNGLTSTGYTPQAQAQINQLQQQLQQANQNRQNLLPVNTGIGFQTNTPIFPLQSGPQSGDPAGLTGYYGGIYNRFSNGLFYSIDQGLGAPTPEIGSGGLRNTTVSQTILSQAEIKTIIQNDPLHLS